jgi:hypothetical protein
MMQQTYVCCLYRSPSGNLHPFLKLLEGILYVCMNLCGDLNMNFLTESTAKEKLETIMITFNLTQVVDFPGEYLIIKEC